MLSACLVGIGEMGLVVSSTALVVKEAPSPIRGSVSGFFSFCGAIGILVATTSGGYFYGFWNASPLFIFGCCNLVLCCSSLLVYTLEKCRTQQSNGEYSPILNPSINRSGTCRSLSIFYFLNQMTLCNHNST